MGVKTIVVLAATIVLAAAVAASAATKSHKMAVPQGGVRAQSTAPRAPLATDLKNGPSTTGGGSLGYNQNNYNDW